MIWSEVNIIRQRADIRRRRDAAVMQMVVGSLLSKKASKQLKEILEKVSQSD